MGFYADTFWEACEVWETMCRFLSACFLTSHFLSASFNAFGILVQILYAFGFVNQLFR